MAASVAADGGAAQDRAATTGSVVDGHMQGEAAKTTIRRTRARPKAAEPVTEEIPLSRDVRVSDGSGGFVLRSEIGSRGEASVSDKKDAPKERAPVRRKRPASVAAREETASSTDASGTAMELEDDEEAMFLQIRKDFALQTSRVNLLGIPADALLPLIRNADLDGKRFLQALEKSLPESERAEGLADGMLYWQNRHRLHWLVSRVGTVSPELLWGTFVILWKGANATDIVNAFFAQDWIKLAK